MKIGKLDISFHRARYLKSSWHYYIVPKRLTLKSNPPIYKWLFWAFSHGRIKKTNGPLAQLAE